MSAFTLAAIFAVAASPQEGPGDPSRIEAFYAGQFKDALKKATATNRMLLIKGVSVIIDEQAARDLKRGTC
jgi:hypothetical protein